MADANLNIRLTVKDDGSTAIEGVSRRLVNLEARASTSARKVGAAWKRAGAAIVAAVSVRQVAQAARGAVAYGDSIAKVAAKVGVASDSLQEYRFAAERAGVSSNTLDMALQRFTRRVAEAAQGKGELKAVLEEYGIAVTDAEGRTRRSEAVLGDLADAIAGAGSESEQLRIAFKAFDSEGAAMVNALKDGSAGLDQMRGRARALGIVLDEDLLATAVAVEDQLTDLSAVVKNKLAATFLGVMPGMLSFARTVGQGYELWAAGMVTSVMKVVAVAEELVEGVQRQWDRLSFGKDELGFFRIRFEEEAFDPLPLERRLQIIEGDHTATVEKIRAQWRALHREAEPPQNSTITLTKTLEDGSGLWRDPTEDAARFGELRAEAEWRAYASAMGQLQESSPVRAYQVQLDQALSYTQTIAGDMAGLFRQLYEDSGGQNRKYWEAYKATAIAETITSTAAGAMRAFKDFPAPVAAGFASMIGAIGATKVALIAGQQPAQSFAEGGFVTRPTYAVVGDAPGGQGEWILPERKLERAVRAAGGGGDTFHVVVNVPINTPHPGPETVALVRAAMHEEFPRAMAGVLATNAQVRRGVRAVSRG